MKRKCMSDYGRSLFVMGGDLIRNQAELLRQSDEPDLSDYTLQAHALGIRFNGMQQRSEGKPMPLFTDNETGSTFALHDDGTLPSALMRCRLQFTPQNARTAERMPT